MSSCGDLVQALGDDDARGGLDQREVREGLREVAQTPVAAGKRGGGSLEVDDRLQVRLMDEYAREDADIRGAALQALQWNALVPADRIDRKVDFGHVVLTGTAD